MAAPPSTDKIIDLCLVAPPPGSVLTKKLPLTFFDLRWFFCCPVQLLSFYELPSTFHWTQTVLPNLKESLSITLRHFFPFAAHLTWPPPPQEPYILYKEGDGIQVTVVESKADFSHLAANHARDFKALKSLFPKLPIICLSSNTTQVVPIMAIQFTVFPNSGISIGLTFNHLAADATSFYHFIKCWASIHRSQGGDFMNSLSLPYCNKDVIQDPNDISSIYLKDIRSWNVLGPVEDVDSGNVLITSVIKRAKIEQLKHLVTTQSKTDGELEGIRISTFVATCAFMWVNLMRLQERICGSLGDDDHHYFVFSADCRQQLALPIPGTYFGNCLAQVLVSAKRGDLMGETGIVVAAKAIARKIFEFMSRGALIGAEKWVSNTRHILKHGRLVSVAGSPKFRAYDTDFGWGKAKKYEYVHIGVYGSFSLVESRQEQGGVDVGVVIARDKLDIFNDIFKEIRPFQCRL